VLRVAETFHLRPLHADDRDLAARLYWDAFRDKLAWILGPRTQGEFFLARCLMLENGLGVTDAGGRLIGVAGIQTVQGGFVRVDPRDLRRVYGPSALWRDPLLGLFETTIDPEVLLIDGISVAPDHRGRGAGSLLLDALADTARARGLTRLRADVIDGNHRARALYERKGFTAKRRLRRGPLARIFGIAAVTALERQL